jgi:hypothetical protein
MGKEVNNVTVSQIAIKGKLPELIKEYAEDQYCQEVLLFLGRHPYTRFSHLTVVRALNGFRQCTEQALNRLTSAGLVKRYVENDVTLYSLGVDE